MAEYRGGYKGTAYIIIIINIHLRIAAQIENKSASRWHGTRVGFVGITKTFRASDQVANLRLDNYKKHFVPSDQDTNWGLDNYKKHFVHRIKRQICFLIITKNIQCVRIKMPIGILIIPKTFLVAGPRRAKRLYGQIGSTCTLAPWVILHFNLQILSGRAAADGRTTVEETRAKRTNRNKKHRAKAKTKRPSRDGQNSSTDSEKSDEQQCSFVASLSWADLGIEAGST